MKSERYFPIPEKRSEKQTTSYKSTTHRILISVILIAGSLKALYGTWGSRSPSVLLMGLLAFAGLFCAVAAGILRKRSFVAAGLWLVPWLVMFAITGFHGYFNGAKMWINEILTRWNQAKDGGLSLFSVGMNEGAVAAFTFLLAVLAGELIWILVSGRHLIGCAVYCLIWFLLMLSGQTFDNWVAGLFLTGFLWLWITDASPEFSCGLIDERMLWAGTLAVFIIGVSLLQPKEDLRWTEQLRGEVKQSIREFRYGKDTLSEGNLWKAATLKQSEETMLQVTEEQEKNLYLRGFTGGLYEDGQWRKMPDSAYGQENAGMLKWLKNQNFDPLMQSAQYYTLGVSSEAPESNLVSIQAEGASRYYYYAPVSLEASLTKNFSDDKDMRIKSTGLRGQQSYYVSEISGTRPAELTVAQGWIENPQSEEQKQYCKAEAVYRKFVYSRYLTVGKSEEDLIQSMFWDDYNSENDGIYSAVCHIRDVLSQDTVYTDVPAKTPDGEEPLEWFLSGQGEGNSMQYASAAVLALRLHGIPARYVEGYYLSSSDVAESENGKVSLTGEDAHAWVEIYFDGIGWLPVDVTPGYYYNTATLKNLVGLPDTARKKASLEENSLDTGKIADTGNKSQELKKNVKQAVKDIMAVLLGILGIAVILSALFLTYLELHRIYATVHERKVYEKASLRKRVLLLEKRTFALLNSLGIEASLGWETGRTERMIVAQIPTVSRGEYSRICEIYEKVIFGEIEPELYEERTLKDFTEKLKEAGKTADWKARLKVRYINDLKKKSTGKRQEEGAE